jgi:hypothetical protein
MTRRKALELRENKVGYCKVRPQDMWPIAKSSMKRDGRKYQALLETAHDTHPHGKSKTL